MQLGFVSSPLRSITSKINFNGTESYWRNVGRAKYACTATINFTHINLRRELAQKLKIHQFVYKKTTTG
jgi:hypothetical protein